LHFDCSSAPRKSEWRQLLEAALTTTRCRHWLDRFFRLTERRTTVRVEVIGGVTTFAAMAYIIAGLILHPILKLLAGRVREVRIGSVVLALACLVFYMFGLQH
jgi:xanthine/uracil/vitamin C permease (AzgA family)